MDLRKQASIPHELGKAIPTGDALASFLLNVPNSGASRRDVNEQEQPGGLLSAFLQDSWKVTRRLTVNYGLRYDYPFLPRYGTKATVGQHGGPETGDMDFSNGTFIVQQLPPLCSERGFAPCIPGTGLPDHVVVSPYGKDHPQRPHQLRTEVRFCLQSQRQDSDPRRLWHRL